MRHALEELLRMLAEATPGTRRHSPGIDDGVVLASLIPAHVGTSAGIELVGLEGVVRLSSGIERETGHSHT